MNSSEIIAHCVLGIEVTALDLNDLLSGALFVRSSIYGVVEQDFFDWPLEVESGAEYVRALARRLGRFDWPNVSQDVLKTLYESVITPETRKRLGEYYTPDWLAEMIVAEVIASPLDTRALDPACGSGTFLFHAVRRYLVAARAAGIGVAEALTGVSSHVYGMDLHPVAVTLARVTYLLAIGSEYLQHPDRGPIYIPVYLGDSMQWSEQSGNLWNAGDLVIAVEDTAELFTTELRFPDPLLHDAAAFDRLVEDMAQAASRREQGSRRPSVSPILQRHGVPQASRATVETTFATMCGLHDQGRNHIWSYYVRNLARPMWLAREGNRVNALIGNPPWLAYRHMPEDLQQSFHAMEVDRGLWAGAENATHQDLSALFVARAVELYLRNGGRFGLVMPNAVVDRDHYAGFRLGSYVSRNSRTLTAFDPSWDFRRVRPHFFPRGSSVIFGTRNGEASREMPLGATIYSGNIGRAAASLESIRDRLIQTPGEVTIRNGMLSPYTHRFRQGAIFAPRLLFFVERGSVGPLGAAAGQIPIHSSRSADEKKPWKDLPAQTGMVEGRFVRPMYSGETLLPYRVNTPLLCVIPENNGQLMTGEDEIARFTGLSNWWRNAVSIWEGSKSRTTNLTLSEQLDYMGKLSAQFPIPHSRVIYNSAGMHVAASKLLDTQGVVNANLYWCSVTSEAEADYLCAILNSPVTTEMVRPLMSYGKDERHVHKHVWKLPIPEFDLAIPALARLSTLGRECAALAQSVQLRENIHFAALRRDVRAVLDTSPQAEEIDALVYELLS